MTKTDELMDDLLAASIVRDIWLDEMERRVKGIRELIVKLAK